VSQTETRQVAELIWRQDLYPRFEPIPARIQQYAESIELLPPIEINQRNEIIDGYHRWIAHKKSGAETIAVTVTPTLSDVELDRLAARRNADFGIQLSTEEKRHKARQWFTGLDVDKKGIADDLRVPLRTVQEWLSRRTKDMKAERERRIAELWLACWTEEEIGKQLATPEGTIAGLVPSLSLENAVWQKSRIFSSYEEPGWEPPIYNIWKVKQKSNKTTVFGNSEVGFTDNLLYMYTEPFDIMLDPFGGGGSTIDVCKKRLRRYWVSDAFPVPERLDMREWDICNGTPPLHKRWGQVALLFLDPPYWWQAKGKYSEKPTNLANMALADFHDTLVQFVKDCAAKMHNGSHIAMMMQPTQWHAPDRQIVDHVIHFAQSLSNDKLRLERRISCPYESQQANAQQVDWAKVNKELLVISREIIVWEVI